MNYFELFGLPVSFRVDLAILKRKYDELSRQYNPDVSTDVAEEKRAFVLEKATEMDKAYNTLTDQDETIKYVLQIKNLLTEDEKYEPDPQFEIEVMDINEELIELELDENQEQMMNVEQKTNRLLLKIYEDVVPIIESYKEDITTEEELLQVKDFYFRKKYLQRILDRIKGIRNIASPS